MNARSAKGKDANRATVIKYTRGMFVSFSWKQVICTSQLTKPYQQWGGGVMGFFFFSFRMLKKIQISKFTLNNLGKSNF